MVSTADPERAEGTTEAVCGRDREGCNGGSHCNQRSDGRCSATQNTASALKERSWHTENIPSLGEQQDEEMEGLHETLTPLQDGSGKRNGTHTTGEEEIIKAVRAAKSLDPSVHLGDMRTQTRQPARGGKEPGMDVDSRVRGGLMKGMERQELSSDTETHTLDQTQPGEQRNMDEQTQRGLHRTIMPSLSM